MEAHGAEPGTEAAAAPLRRSPTTLICPRCEHVEERAPSYVDSDECPQCAAEGETAHMRPGFRPGAGPNLETVRGLIGRFGRGRTR